jgi:hypothetical protein
MPITLFQILVDYSFIYLYIRQQFVLCMNETLAISNVFRREGLCHFCFAHRNSHIKPLRLGTDFPA